MKNVLLMMIVAVISLPAQAGRVRDEVKRDVCEYLMETEFPNNPQRAKVMRLCTQNSMFQYQLRFALELKFQGFIKSPNEVHECYVKLDGDFVPEEAMCEKMGNAKAE